MNSAHLSSKFSNLRFSIKHFFRNNQIKLYILLAVALFGIFTGIFTAVKLGVTTTTVQGYGLTIFANGKIFSFDIFFSRMLSHIIMIAVLSVASLNVFALPLGHIFIIYRTYLIGFNCTLLITSYSLVGVVTSIVVIIPIQLAVLCVSFVFYCLLMDRAIEKKRFGVCHGPKYLKLFLIFLLILTILNLIETLLLILLSATVILVI